MSRGPGKIEQAIEAAFKAEPDNAFTVQDLCERAYPGINKIERKHRVSVIRAATALADRLEYWTWFKSGCPGNTLIFWNWTDVHSYGMARLKGDNLCCYQARRAVADCWRNDEQQLRDRLAPGGEDNHLINPGGAWFLHTEEMLAEHRGDTKKAAKIKAARKADMEKTTAALRAII